MKQGRAALGYGGLLLIFTGCSPFKNDIFGDWTLDSSGLEEVYSLEGYSFQYSEYSFSLSDPNELVDRIPGNHWATIYVDTSSVITGLLLDEDTGDEYELDGGYNFGFGQSEEKGKDGYFINLNPRGEISEDLSIFFNTYSSCSLVEDLLECTVETAFVETIFPEEDGYNLDSEILAEAAELDVMMIFERVE